MPNIAKREKMTKYTLKEVANRFEHREIYLGSASSYLWIGKGADIDWASKMLDVKIKNKLKRNIAKGKKYIKTMTELIPQLKAEMKMIEECLPELEAEASNLKIKIETIKEALKVQRDIRKKTKDKSVFEEATESIKKLQTEKAELKSQYDLVKPQLDSKRRRLAIIKDKIPYTEKRLVSVGKTTENNKEYLKNYIPLIERKVRDIYKRSPVDDCEICGVAVIVDGKEEGNYWTKGEFLAGNWLTD